MTAATRRLRVLSIATLYPNSVQPNFGVFVERQMEAAVRTGEVDLTVVNPVGLPPFPLSLHPRYRALARIGDEVRGNVRVLRPRFTLVPRLGGPFNACAVTRAVLPLARRLHAEQPLDLIDAQFFYPDGPTAVRIARALGLPSSIKARGSDVHLWGRRFGTAGQVRRAGMAASGLLAVSAGLAGDMAALGIPRGKIAIHRTGLDRTLFHPRDRAKARAALDLDAEAVVLATVGALIPRKGQSFAIEALPALPDAILLLAGSGPDEPALRRKAAELGVAGRVRFLGAVPNSDLPVVLSAADVFVLPTASEGLANAWVEALACGTPIVTTPLPGAVELDLSPRQGQLVPRDPAAIAAAVTALFADPPDRATVAEAVASYSWEANAEALVAHWRRLAGQ